MGTQYAVYGHGASWVSWMLFDVADEATPRYQ